MILGAMVQKLWVIEVFGQGLARASMCWSQLHQILQILWVMNCSGGKLTVAHNNYEFYQNYCGL
jgi:hypothetical protein